MTRLFPILVVAIVVLLAVVNVATAYISIPLSGDLNGDGTDSYGTFDPSTSEFIFNGKTVRFGNPNDLPVVGDWDKDGCDEIGVYRPDEGGESTFYLVTRDWSFLSGPAGFADRTISFGYYPDNIPIAGDWDGDGDDDIGGFNPGNNKYYLYLLNLETESATSYKDVRFGISGDKPIVGDWDGDGFDDVGVYREFDFEYNNNLVFYFDLDLSGDQADLTTIPLGNNGDIAVIGDWDDDGDDDIGLYRAGTFMIDPNFNVPHDLIYLNNGMVKVGVDLQWGGGISVIMHRGLNLIDNHDTGRLAQVAFYDDSSDWDPVQGGDVFNQGSPVLDYDREENMIYTKTHPRDWKTGVLTDTYIEQWVSLKGQAVKVHYKLTHWGSETHTFHDQEFPCAYINTQLYRLITYTKSDPWINDGIDELSIPQTDPGTPNTEFYPTEYWASFVSDLDFGLTLYSPDHTSKWAAHRFTINTRPGYLATVDQFAIGPGAVIEGTEYFIAGDYMEARSIIYSLLHDTTPPASITNLCNTTGQTWINWTWENPDDDDFNHTIVYLNGSWEINTSYPFFNASYLDPNTNYEIGTHTVDIEGNVNNTWVNQTVKTLVQKGDLNGDGEITSADVQITLTIAFVNEYTPEADIDENGYVNILDVRMIMQAVVGNIEI